MLDVASQQPVEVGDLRDVLELVQRDERPVAAALLQSKRQVEKRVQSRQRVDLLPDLELRADAECAEREAEVRLLQEVLDLVPQRALEGLRVGALEADGHVRDRDHAVEVDDDRDQTPSRSPSRIARLIRLVLPYFRGA